MATKVISILSRKLSIPPNTSPKALPAIPLLNSKKFLMFLITMEVEMSQLTSWSIPSRLLTWQNKPLRFLPLSKTLDTKEKSILEPSLTSSDSMKMLPHRELFNQYTKPLIPPEKECSMLLTSRELLLQLESTSQLLKSTKLWNMLTETEMEVLPTMNFLPL